MHKTQPSQIHLWHILRKIFGFMVSHHVIKANPERLLVFLEMSPLTTQKEVQCLVRHIALLSKFVAISGDKCLPFFKALR